MKPAKLNRELTTGDFFKIVTDEVNHAEDFKNGTVNVSDIRVGRIQYVDLVQEGGGVLGIALLGYTYILEKAGIRFFSLAGTSAGAINTLLLASLKEDTRTKSERILEYLINKNLFDLVDGDRTIKRFIQSYLDDSITSMGIKKIFILLKALFILLFRLGLNPGKDFENWIETILHENGIYTTDDLLEGLKDLPGLKPTDKEVLRRRIVIVASDISTQTKVQFPEMADLYWKDWQKVNPARYLRASMSIPLFFRPVKIKHISNDPVTLDLWERKADYKGKRLPCPIRMVDGGILSNFPINVFHNETRVPKLPTFGVRLSAYREEPNKTGRLGSFVWSMIKTMKQLYDTDFLMKHEDYQRLICNLDTDNKFNWLNFNMSSEDKLALFKIGAEGAIKFLDGFEWEKYKILREDILRRKITYPPRYVTGP